MALALSGTPSLAQGQSASGTWWDLGMGAGWTRFTCDACQEERELGPTLRIAVGGTASGNLLVGVQGAGWTHREEEDDEREILFTVMGTGIARPTGGGFSVEGGLGWVGWRAGDFDYDAIGVQLGIGYDFPTGDTYSVRGALRLTGASFGSLQNQGETAFEDVSVSLVQFTISVTSR